MPETASRSSASHPATERIAPLAYAVMLAQLLLAAWVVLRFDIESRAFFELTLLTAGGFAVHALLPLRWRLPFFTLLSFVAIFRILGWSTGGWLVGIGLALIALAHVPGPVWLRSGLLLIAGLGLVLIRGDWIRAPFSGAVWPILGSMFMFRLIVYVYDLQHEKVPATPARTLAYFFMLPNVCFPLFPVIDYRTFRRTYYDRDAYGIYQTGMSWIVRGLIHLILYRAVNYYLVLAPDEVFHLGDLAHHMLATYLLYLRVSGQFHVIVGLLHIFGFNLPETHHLYYLATTFNDYWRRINIYWKDFMMKVFYYPAFFRLRKWSGTGALVISTALVFFLTWALHSYQWFWLRGSFPFLWQDVAFWGILGTLVVVNALRESRKGRKRSLGRERWSWGRTVGTGLQAATLFTVICVLWSLWMSESVGDWLHLWRSAAGAGAANLPHLVWILVAFAGYSLASGIWLRLADRPSRAQASNLPWLPATAATATLGALLLVTVPSVSAYLGAGTSERITDLRGQRLGAQDEEMLERGYYEELVRIDRFNSQLWELYSRKPAEWVDLRETDSGRTTGDFLIGEMLPLQDFTFKGARLRTNRWGMRDRYYSKAKGDGVLRLAVLGNSYTMGSGVEDDETYEQLTEESLSELADSKRVESLNFAVAGYAATQQVAVLEQKALPFEPDVLLYVAHGNEVNSILRHLTLLVRDEVEIPYPELREILERSGARAGQGRAQMNQALKKVVHEVQLWSYERMASVCRDRGIVPIWVMVPRLTEKDGAENFEAMRDAAERSGFETIVLGSLYAQHDRGDLRLASWDSHPNAVGHRLIADYLVREIQRLAPEVGLEF